MKILLYRSRKVSDETVRKRMKTILILSHQDDDSTSNVIEWLVSFNAKFIRINTEDEVDVLLKINNQQESIFLNCNGEIINIENIGAVWFRRGWISIPVASPEMEEVSEEIYAKIIQHLRDERDAIISFIFDQLKRKPHINLPSSYDVNKLSVLMAAKRHGLLIPDSMVTKDSGIINNLNSFKDGYITKCITNGISIIIRENYMSFPSTFSVDDENVITNVSKYYYSLFQTNIPKKYELRIFFLFDKYYPAAIIPENNDGVDGRILDVQTDKGLVVKRIMPIDIPNEIVCKLQLLMKELVLESGSIDMIVTPDDKYVFLEVNPVGQFDYVGKRCNYQLDKEIALTLLRMNNDKATE